MNSSVGVGAASVPPSPIGWSTSTVCVRMSISNWSPSRWCTDNAALITVPSKRHGRASPPLDAHPSARGREQRHPEVDRPRVQVSRGGDLCPWPRLDRQFDDGEGANETSDRSEAMTGVATVHTHRFPHLTISRSTLRFGWPRKVAAGLMVLIGVGFAAITVIANLYHVGPAF